MERGKIVLVRFPFTDYSDTKLRPVVIISVDNKKDVCVAFISSVVPLQLDETDYLLTKEEKDFSLTGFKKESVFKMKKIATIDRDLIVGSLGHLSEELQREIDQKLKTALDLS